MVRNIYGVEYNTKDATRIACAIMSKDYVVQKEELYMMSKGDFFLHIHDEFDGEEHIYIVPINDYTQAIEWVKSNLHRRNQLEMFENISDFENIKPALSSNEIKERIIGRLAFCEERDKRIIYIQKMIKKIKMI